MRALLLLAAAGCGGQALLAPDGAPLGSDASAPLVDAAPFDAVPPDAPPADASPIDVIPLPPDADPCADCIPSSECLDAICQAGACVERPVADGTTCGGTDTTICVAGACVVRACGDGYREPGPLPAREACDDGNTASGDACSSDCEPTLLVVAARLGETDTPTGGQAQGVGIDGQGRALFVWRASMGPGAYELQARRYTAGGVAIDAAPIGIDGFASGWEAEPVVVGLAEGWVVAWTSPAIDGDLGGIAYAVVAPDGSMSAPAAANEETNLGQLEPSLTRTGDGFAIAWTDQSQLLPGTSGARVRARRFASDGTPLGGEIAVSLGPEDQQTPSIATAPDGHLLVAWTAVGFEGVSVPTVIGRRFSSAGTPLDAAPFLLADREPTGEPMWAFGAAAAPRESGGWAVAWTSRGEDFPGDIRTRVVGAAGPSIPVAIEVGAAERDASVAPLVGDAFLVLWRRDEGMDDLGLAAIDGAPPPEAPLVEPWLAGPGIQQTGSIVSAGDRVWVSWSDNGAVAGVPRAFVAFLLAKE